MGLLEAKNLKKYYGKGDAMIKALDGVNLTIEKESFVSIMGTSGSGKSTLLNILGGLDRPTSGSVIIDGISLNELNEEELTVFRRRNIGFVFQFYNLIPLLNVYENIIFPLELDNYQIDSDYIEHIISVLGISKKLNCLSGELSGGHQQRVAIARALAAKPAIILADEPTGNLDSKSSQDVLGLLKMTSQLFRQTIVMITHNEEIAQLADRTIRIEDGKMIE